MLTGQPPFAGDDAVSIICQHLHADPVPPSRHEPGVPEALDRVVLELLAKRGEDRPDGAAAVRELARGRAGRGARPRRAAERADNPLDRLAGGVFVGREREIEQLREAVDAALAGQRRPAAAGRRARHRQDPHVRGARHLRAGQRRPGLLGPLPRGRGRAGLLAVGAGDPRLRARRRPRGDGLADGRRRRRDRPARPRGGRAARHRAGRSRPTARRRASGSSTRSRASWSPPRATARWSSSSTTCTGPTSPRCCCSSTSAGEIGSAAC